MTLRCEYPVDDGAPCGACGKPAVWTTDDLAEIRHLCAEHCAEAMTMNDFRTELAS